ncbi:hypothetical protein IMCC14465_08580 [alpha proteobacterium IMCC14465]|uniref:Nucleoside triphosphate pyrophosphatase n=1 Tax=alpha proteobacterium IMCC14465 TaxID=1220535 RepID=J9DVP7_9PROT|nr:hypothetical protein IMCC14465_08580 [alpha proteobacterium IMCC14465]
MMVTTNADAPRLVLASASKVRADILSGAGVDFDICPSDVDENILKDTLSDGGALALALAAEKAHAVSAQYPDHIVLGADQILSCDGRLFDKPRNMDEASKNLMFLRGKTHQLINGLALVLNGETVWQNTATASLTMREFSEAFLDMYLHQAGTSILSSVGCYRLEAEGSQLFEKIDGDYFTVLGLPLMPLLGALRQHGVLML